ncbi:MAG: hypothetical protein WC612_05230 [Bdellovibrionales bacterium]|jgi:F-type H+-transporting ATPase subunit b
MHETSSFLNNTTFWYAVAVVAFLAVAMKSIRGPLLSWLDGEIAKVRFDLDEAKRLHAEAEATLQDYRSRERDAVMEAERIVEQAREDANRLRSEAQDDLRLMLERHEKIVVDRIRLAHEDALAEVRAYIIDEALSEARGKLNTMAGGAETSALLDKIIEDLPSLKIAKTA